MKKLLLIAGILALVFTGFAAAQDDMSEYFTDPDKVEDMWFTIFTQYTFSAENEMTDDETNLLVTAFVAGMDYVAGSAKKSDRLCVAFMYDNNTAMAFICTYKDYKLYSDGDIDSDTFMERVSVETLEL
jgi:hypothetical protein